MSSFYLRLGQRRRPDDDGVLVTLVINLGLYVAITLVLGVSGHIGKVTLSGMGLFALGGICSSLAGRTLWIRGIRLIGPARATSLEGTYPIVASALAVVFLHEQLGGTGWLGALLAIAGVLLLGNERPARKEAPSPGPPTGSVALLVRPAATGPRRAQLVGFSMGVGSGVAFGAGSFTRKLALLAMPAPLVGSCLSASVAVVGLAGAELAQGGGWARLRKHLVSPPVGFMVAGVLTAAGQLLNLVALEFAPVSRVTVINAVQPVLAVVVGVLFFRQVDRIDWQVTAASIAIVAGIVLVVR